MENEKTKIKIDKNLLALLPQQLKNSLALREGDELEFSEAAAGVWILTRKGIEEAVKAFLEKEKSKAEKGVLSEKELALLAKLDSVRFERRIPGVVNKTLTVAERKTLECLLKKQFVTIYREGKYAKNGVYNIPREVYAELKKAEKSEKKTEAKDMYSFFEQNGYVVVEGEEDAKSFSSKLEEQIKAREILGARGFDRKYYVMNKKMYDSLVEKVRKAVEEGSGAREVAECLKISEELAKTILELMKEEGEAIEKQKGVFFSC